MVAEVVPQDLLGFLEPVVIGSKDAYEDATLEARVSDLERQLARVQNELAQERAERLAQADEGYSQEQVREATARRDELADEKRLELEREDLEREREPNHTR